MKPDYDLVCFDMDETLTRTKSSWAWIHHILGTDDTEDTLLFNKGLLSQAEFIKRDVAKWKAVKPDFCLDDVMGIFDSMPLIGGIGETIDSLHENGIKCVIISGGVDIAADMLCKRFGFDGYSANRLLVGSDGRIQDEGVADVDLRDKGLEVKKYMEEFQTCRERIVSVGNSFTDVPMFKMSGLSIAFNPTDELVVKEADCTVRSEIISDIMPFIL